MRESHPPPPGERAANGCAYCLMLLCLVVAGLEISVRPDSFPLVGLLLSATWCLTAPGLAAGAVLLGRRLRGYHFVCPKCLRPGPPRFACGSCGREIPAGEAIPRLGDSRCRHCKNPLRSSVRARENPKAYCDHCRGTSPLDPAHCRRVRVIGVVPPEALPDLARALKVTPSRHDHGAYALADDGKRLTYVVSSAAPDHPLLPHARRIWVASTRGDLLDLGQHLDRVLAALPRRRAQRLTVCVEDPDPEPAVRNLLESRFRRVRYGVSAQEMASGNRARTRAPEAKASGASGPWSYRRQRGRGR